MIYNPEDFKTNDELRKEITELKELINWYRTGGREVELYKLQKENTELKEYIQKLTDKLKLDEDKELCKMIDHSYRQ